MDFRIGLGSSLQSKICQEYIQLNNLDLTASACLLLRGIYFVPTGPQHYSSGRSMPLAGLYAMVTKDKDFHCQQRKVTAMRSTFGFAWNNESDIIGKLNNITLANHIPIPP
jgi:hypothetical protein